MFAFGLHHNPKLAYCLRQLAYNNPFSFFCKAFYASFCKNFKIFFIYGKIKRFVLKVHCLEANGKPNYMRVPIRSRAHMRVRVHIYMGAYGKSTYAVDVLFFVFPINKNFV